MEDLIEKQVEDFEKKLPDFIDAKSKDFYVDHYQNFLSSLKTKTIDELISIYNHEVDATRAGSWVSIRPVFLDALNLVCLERKLPPFYEKLGEPEVISDYSVVAKSHAKRKIKLEGNKIIQEDE